jgi:hypothetical protein
MLDFVAQLHRMGLLPSHFPVHTHHNSVNIQDYDVWCPYTYSWQQQLHTPLPCSRQTWKLKKNGHSNLSYLPGPKQRKSALPVISFMAISASCNTNRIYSLRKCQTDIAKLREKSIEPSAPTAWVNQNGSCVITW